MALSRRSCALAVLGLVTTSPLGGGAAAPQGTTRITAAANVTMREAPSPESPAVAQVPLGTELADAGPAGLEKTWIRVRLADGREGWVMASLTKPLDPVWRWPTFDRIIADRLSRKGDGFPAAVELIAFIERVAPEYTDPDGRARIELSRLRAMASALALVPMRGAEREPYASWLAARMREVTYDEPGGRWMLTDASVWDLHARVAGTAPADEIAWFAVTNGLAGECEGHVSCYLAARDRLHGEYLRRHPAGRHAGEAVGEVKGTADLVTAPTGSKAAFAFDPKQDCRDLSASLEALTLAVGAARVDSRDAALGSLTALKRLCQAP